MRETICLGQMIFCFIKSCFIGSQSILLNSWFRVPGPNAESLDPHRWEPAGESFRECICPPDDARWCIRLQSSPGPLECCEILILYQWAPVNLASFIVRGLGSLGSFALNDGPGQRFTSWRIILQASVHLASSGPLIFSEMNLWTSVRCVNPCTWMHLHA